MADNNKEVIDRPKLLLIQLEKIAQSQKPFVS
jgi:hypothetical protein